MANITIKMDQGHSVQVSCGNAKMTKGFGIFNLVEKLTCINATAKCINCCYAAKASRMYPSVLPRRLANYEASQQSDFISSMIMAITKLSKQKTFSGFFRLHEAGDFYSQLYVDSWVEIIKAFPTIKFLAFTKSFSLDYSKMPSNMQMVYSVMEDTDLTTVPEGTRAYAGNVPGMPTDLVECPGLCDTCGACWGLGKKGLSVHFDMH